MSDELESVVLTNTENNDQSDGNDTSNNQGKSDGKDTSNNQGKSASSNSKSKKSVVSNRNKRVDAQTMPTNNNREYYSFNGVNLRDPQQAKKILREYNNLCRATTLKYKDFAKENVHYKNVNSREAIEYLRKHNGMYAMAMLSNVMAPFEKEGITIGSLFKAVMTYKTILVINPDAEMDIMRGLTSLKEQIDNKRDSVAVGKRKYSLGSRLLDERINILTNNTMEKHIKDHDLDSLVMTPRQIAYLKLNFAEQCYADMRKNPKNQSYVEMCKRDYDIALRHLDAIAKNSGFDMNAVAQDERYIVGLKMCENPSYADLFEETHGLYGVVPVIEGTVYKGVMVTPDGHDLTPTTDGIGQFNVRVPLTEDHLKFYSKSNIESTIDEGERQEKKEFNKTSYPLTLARYGQELGIATQYFRLNNNALSKDMNTDVVNQIASRVVNFKANLERECISDKIDSKFVTSYFVDSYMDVLTPKTTAEDSQIIKDYVKVFESEFETAICKKALQSNMFAEHRNICELTSDPNYKFSSYLYSVFNNGKPSNGKFVSIENAIKKALSLPDDTKTKDVYTALYCDYLKDMSAEDIGRMALHTCNNMEQGARTNGIYGRKGKKRVTVEFSDSIFSEHKKKTDAASKTSDSASNVSKSTRDKEIIIDVVCKPTVEKTPSDDLTVK